MRQQIWGVFLGVAMMCCFTACGESTSSRAVCEAATYTNTGDLGVDIVGTWSGCFETEDELAPWCDFRADGSLVLVTPNLQDNSGAIQGSIFERGSVIEWSYAVDGNALTVYDAEGEVFYDEYIVIETTKSGLLFEPFLDLDRLHCTGPGFAATGVEVD